MANSTGLRIILQILVLLAVGIYARFCSHTEKGACEVPEFGGWCFHDKSTGEFSCDDEKFCSGRKALQGKTQIAGCFEQNSTFKCCCNKGQFCNTLLTEYAPVTNVTQKCSYSTDEPGKNSLQFRDCSEAWCFGILSANQDGGPSTIQRGCESRSLMRHQTAKVMHDEFKNNTEWHISQVFWDAPRCPEIIQAGGFELNRTEEEVRVCLDFKYVNPAGEDSKAKVCCCHGTDKCNENVLWGDDAITMDDINKYRVEHGIATSSGMLGFKVEISRLAFWVTVFGFLLGTTSMMTT